MNSSLDGFKAGAPDALLEGSIPGAADMTRFCSSSDILTRCACQLRLLRLGCAILYVRQTKLLFHIEEQDILLKSCQKKTQEPRVGTVSGKEGGRKHWTDGRSSSRMKPENLRI